MRFGKAIWMPGLIAVIASLALAACGSDATATPIPAATISPTVEPASQQGSPGLSSEESTYLSEVVRAEQSAMAIFQAFGTIFTQTYPVREALIAALLQAGVGTPFIEKTAILEALVPPERFREDHKIWLEASKEQLRTDTAAAEAVEAGDLVRFSILNGQLSGFDVTARIALSPVFCQRVGLAGEQLAICTPDDSVLEGEFETALNGLIRGFMPAFATSQGSIGFRLSLTPEELNQILSETAVNSRKAFQGFAAGLEMLTPPEELTADFGRLRDFSGRAVEIVAEVDRLGKANNIDGARGELLKLEPAFCDARASFEAEDFKDAVAILFVGSPRTCGGTPF